MNKLLSLLENQNAISSPEYGERILSEEDVKDFPDIQIQFMKQQLGTRLKGDETKLKIISRFLSEIDVTLQTDKTADCMPIFFDLPRIIERGYIFIDGDKLPFDEADIIVSYFNDTKKYIIQTEFYTIEVIYVKEMTYYISLGYQLTFPDVTRRLYGFKKVLPLLKSKNIQICCQRNKTNLYLDLCVLNEEKRKEQLKTTYFWIEQMKKIANIEEYFNIKFKLPEKADYIEYVHIDILYDSINDKECLSLNGIYDENNENINQLEITELLFLAESYQSTVKPLELFDYYFYPINICIMPTTLYWNTINKTWENRKGYIPAKCNFIIK